MGDEARNFATDSSAACRPATPNLRLAPVQDRDMGRLRSWLDLSAVHAWWGSRNRAEAEISVALASPSAICRIMSLCGEPIGYAHAVDAALLRGDAHSRATVESGTWECAAFIGSEFQRGRGLGGLALGLLADEVFSTTLSIACSLRVPVTKEHAVRAIEAAGFRWVHVENDPVLGHVWLMRRDRPTELARR